MLWPIKRHVVVSFCSARNKQDFNLSFSFWSYYYRPYLLMMLRWPFLNHHVAIFCTGQTRKQLTSILFKNWPFQRHAIFSSPLAEAMVGEFLDQLHILFRQRHAQISLAHTLTVGSF
jgi:hypothetical protein